MCIAEMTFVTRTGLSAERLWGPHSSLRDARLAHALNDAFALGEHAVEDSLRLRIIDRQYGAAAAAGERRIECQSRPHRRARGFLPAEMR